MPLWSRAGALEEVDWLRMKLERIEGALKDQVGKGGTLARIMSQHLDRALLPDAAAAAPKDELPIEQTSRYGCSMRYAPASFWELTEGAVQRWGRLAAGMLRVQDTGTPSPSSIS